MPCTVVFYHDAPAETLMITLRDAAGTVVNGSGNTLIESAGLRYSATITQVISGWFIAQIFDADGLLYTGNVKTASDGGVYRIDDPAATIAVIGDVSFNELSVSGFSSAALQQLAGMRQIQITAPTLAGQNLSQSLVRGDNYTSAYNAALEFSRSDFPDLPAGARCELNARSVEGDVPFQFQIRDSAASIPIATGTKVVRFEPTSSQTAQWEPGKYEFDVTVTFPDGERRTFVGPQVYLRVLERIVANS